MPYAVPKEELEISDLKKYRDTALSQLESLIRSVGKDPKDYIFRDILPKTDLGLANEEWRITYTTAYAWETKVNITLPSDKFIVFYGYTNLSGSPKTVAIKFYKGAIPIELIQVENLYPYVEPVGYFKPFGYREADILKIDFYGTATGDDKPVLRGVVAELKSVTIGEK